MRNSMLGKTRNFLVAAFCGLAFASAAPVHAETDWPTGDIRLIVPFGAGGASDAVARALGESLSDSLGESVVVENRTGAGGSIGASAVARSKPDGSVFLLGSTSEIIQYPLVYDDVPYSVEDDFTPIAQVGSSPMVLIANGDLDVDDIGGLIAYAHKNPRALKFGSAGIGASTHLAVELLMSMSDMEMRHVPYRGSANIVSDVVAGVLDVSMPTLAAIKPYEGDDRMKVLAVSTAESTPLLPDVMGMKEAGVEDYDVALWTGVFAPAGMDQEIVDKMYAAIQEALGSDDLKDLFAKLGAVPVQKERDDFLQMLKDDSERWGNLIVENEISVTQE